MPGPLGRQENGKMNTECGMAAVIDWVQKVQNDLE